jgi:hypothetical protein
MAAAPEAVNERHALWRRGTYCVKATGGSSRWRMPDHSSLTAAYQTRSATATTVSAIRERRR